MSSELCPDNICPGALAHHLQNTKWPAGDPNMADWSGKMSLLIPQKNLPLNFWGPLGLS